jgi:tetrahydromethanopterin S-methyltransferase subunit B
MTRPFQSKRETTMQDEAMNVNIKQIQEVIDAEVKPLREKIAELEKEIELLPLKEKIKDLDKKLNETG